MMMDNKKCKTLNYSDDGRVLIGPRKTDVVSEKQNFPATAPDRRFIIASRKNTLDVQEAESKESSVQSIFKLNYMNEKDDEDATSEKVKLKKSSKNNQENHVSVVAARETGDIPFHPDKKVDKKIRRRLKKVEGKTIITNDLGNVDIFMSLYRGLILYNTDSSTWYWWTGKYWKVDSDFVVYNFAVKLMHKLYKNGNRSDSKSQKEHRILSGNHRGICSMLEMAKTRCVCHTEDFDTEKHLLNVKNGVVDLRTKTLYAHKPKYMFTQFIDVEYDPNAKGERFEKFVFEICNKDKELSDFVQVTYGYTITGETKEQTIFFESGQGANGKSTMNNAIETVLSNYTETVGFALFKKERWSSPNAASPELAKLSGKRLVFCRETESDIINEAKIKELTGSTKITARALYAAPFTYTPKFKLLFETNHMPIIKGADHGIWRRIVVIPFECRFKKDESLEEILLGEKQVILRWLIDGAYKYYNDGFPESKAVKKATREYKNEEDTVGTFVKYAVKTKSGGMCSAKLMYEAYLDFCTNSASTPLNIKEFKQALSFKGYKNKRTNSGMFWIDVSVKE